MENLSRQMMLYDVVVPSVIRIVERVHTRLICVSCFDCMRMKVKTLNSLKLNEF